MTRDLFSGSDGIKYKWVYGKPTEEFDVSSDVLHIGGENPAMGVREESKPLHHYSNAIRIRMQHEIHSTDNQGLIWNSRSVQESAVRTGTIGNPLTELLASRLASRGVK